MKKIIVDRDNKRFLINTSCSSYAIAVNNEGHLVNTHWGGIIFSLDDLPNVEELQEYRYRRPEQSVLKRQEYPGWGGEFYDEPALKATFADGTRSTILKYKTYELKAENNAEVLRITLEDCFSSLIVELYYRVFTDCDILERWCEISNNGNGDIVLESIMSAAFNLPRINNDYRLTHLSGRWAKEGMINHTPVNQGRITIESRTGLSGPHAMPYFALDSNDANENQGRVWFGTLEWSGNWKITIHRDAFEEVSVVGGISDFDFSYLLEAGEKFTTPVFSCGVSNSGFGEASRMLHDYQLKHLLPPVAKEPIPLIVNTWASLHADVDESSVLGLIEKSAEVGAELFVIDDGWQKALGDWTPDSKKFPNGLKVVIDRAKQLGMEFGLWVEIESFEERSDLYKQHPDWAMQYENRPLHSKYREDVDRTSYLINFARDDVRAHFYQRLHQLVAETGITYLKLDMNYFFSTPGWKEVPLKQQQSIWYHYANNIYKVFDHLTQDFPKLRIENCASGCARSDLGMSRYFSRINRSDNQDPLDILKLHEGFSMLHWPGLAGGACHISDDMHHINFRQLPMTFQAIAGMLGSLAVGKNLPACSQNELKDIHRWGELYKKIRHIVHKGYFYKLASHYDNSYAVYQYVSKDKSESLVFIFTHAFQFGQRLPAFKFQGLDENMRYNLKIYGNESSYENEFKPKSGRGLMEVGIQSDMLGDYQARILHLSELNNENN